jgi:hypothetical protein
MQSPARKSLPEPQEAVDLNDYVAVEHTIQRLEARAWRDRRSLGQPSIDKATLVRSVRFVFWQRSTARALALHPGSQDPLNAHRAQAKAMGLPAILAATAARRTFLEDLEVWLKALAGLTLP